MTVVNPSISSSRGTRPVFPFQYTSDLKTELAPIWDIDQGPKFAAYLKDIPREADVPRRFLVALNAEQQKKISYVIRMEPGIQTPERRCPAAPAPARLGVALDPYLPSPRARRALRLRYLMQFAARHRSGRRSARVEAISPTCMPGRKSISRRGLMGSTSTSGMLTARGTFPCCHAAFARPRRSRAPPVLRGRIRVRHSQAHP